LNQVFGIDINPIAVLISKINVLLLIRGIDSFKIIEHIYLGNSLNLDPNIIKAIGKVDLLISNPPWLILRDIESNDYQMLLKKVSIKNSIKPEAKDIPNLEVSTLFFYEMSRLFLRSMGTIFFIMTPGVLNGSHSDKFRQFHNFDSIEIWKFEDKLFNLPNICIKAKYKKGSSNPYPIKLKIINNNFNIAKETSLIPSYTEPGKIKNLITIEDKRDLIDIKNSYYYNKILKGADLYPRSLLFVDVIQLNGNLSLIKRDSKATSRSKIEWDNYCFENIEIESQYIFNVIKSDLLVPFYYTDLYKIVLPIDYNYNLIPIDKLGPKMRKFYQNIDSFYKANIKKTTKFNELWENINFRNKLIKQNSEMYKVVYNEAGNKLRAAVIKPNILVDYTLYYYQTNDINECYYLCSILNSDFINKQIKIIKSTRHFTKRPFKFPIPKYSKLNTKHNMLKDLAKKCEKIVRNSLKSNQDYNDALKNELSIINRLVKDILCDKRKFLTFDASN
ncbi:MAG: Eco57I restriction-modification methylase domain-containing protein, partial [Candidatus Helarchaeota archaeon]